MLRWAWMLGGLLIWLGQFSALYALSSLAEVIDRADSFPWRMAGLGLTLACAVLCGLLLVLAVRRRRTGHPSFTNDIAALSAAVGLVSVLFQGAPVLIGY